MHYQMQIRSILKFFGMLVMAKFNRRMSRIRYNNGGEYTSNEWKNYCKFNGIETEPTVPYTPHQNGVEERMNLTLMNKARAMLYESGLKKDLWYEAIMCATYLTNRSPTFALKDENSGKIQTSKLKLQILIIQIDV